MKRRGGIQLAKEIRWLLYKFGESDGEEKERYLRKIHNWFEAHPKEAKLVKDRFLQVLVKRLEKGDVT